MIAHVYLGKEFRIEDIEDLKKGASCLHYDTKTKTLVLSLSDGDIVLENMVYLIKPCNIKDFLEHANIKTQIHSLVLCEDVLFRNKTS